MACSRSAEGWPETAMTTEQGQARLCIYVCVCVSVSVCACVCRPERASQSVAVKYVVKAQTRIRISVGKKLYITALETRNERPTWIIIFRSI